MEAELIVVANPENGVRLRHYVPFWAVFGRKLQAVAGAGRRADGHTYSLRHLVSALSSSLISV